MKYFSSSLLRGNLVVTILLFLTAVNVPADQKKVIIDFEDFGSWRMKENAGLKPGYWWPAYINLSGSDLVKYHGDYVGELRFGFDPAASTPYLAGFERAKMSMTSGFLTGIEFDADARHLPVNLRFVIEDSTNKRFRVKPIALSGEGWNHYRLEFNAETIPGFADCKFPARLKRIGVESSVACEGSVFLDDITLTGHFTKRDQITLTPIYDGLANLPDREVTLRYRARNAQAADLAGTVQLELKNFSGKKLQSKSATLSLPATGATEFIFKIGKLPIGAYEVLLTAEAGGYKAELQDHFGVFVPNGKRLNHHPMWFGVNDQGNWQGDTENKRHLEWMKLLGVDLDRFGFASGRVTPANTAVGFEGWRRLIKQRADSDIDILFLWSDMPPWMQKKADYRGTPDSYDEYEAFSKSLGAFLKEFPNVKYFEFWNEPDVEFYHGTLTEYLEMFKRFTAGFKQTNPTLPILSGGVTVQHPREKAGFSKGMFQQAAGYYDIAAYHSHGPVTNNERNQKIVEGWLNEAGLDKRFANTETGDRSLYDVDGRHRQAITLVKKIVHSKSIPKFEFYIWFTLQDYWDMDPEADDSFGLVTSDNRPKPSFIAYNNLINKLADTKPVPSEMTPENLTLYAFRKDDGRYVYAGWPVASRKSGILWIKTAQSVEISDIFGATKSGVPLGNILPVSFGDLPLYLSGNTAEEKIKLCAPGEEFLKMDTELIINSGQPASLPVTFRNPTDKSIDGVMSLVDETGRSLATQPLKVDAGKTFTWSATIAGGNATETYDEQVYHLDLKFADKSLPSFSFPIQVIPSYLIRKIASLDVDPAKWPDIGSAPSIAVNRPEQVVELTYDPSIPAWKGPDDLSATAQAVHDDRGIRLRIEVQDDTAGALQRKDQLFRSDDVQVAFGRPDEKEFAILDIGQSTEGPAVWCSQHKNPERKGQWNIPLKITRTAKGLAYDVYLPFEHLGLANTGKSQPIRFTFMVNEDDGRGRVRWIQWKDGIGKNRSLEMLGYGTLE